MDATSPKNTLIPIGLFDFENYREIVEAIHAVLHMPKDEIHERLFWEAIQPGWNTNQTATEFGITPHVYDERMEEFYNYSQSFIFELLVSHLDNYCKKIDEWIANYVSTRFPSPKNTQILAFGDGIGTDSLRFAVAGYRTTYFDFEGYSSRFALYRFQRQEVREQIHIIHHPSQIPTDTFDVVICREVLEHVPDPFEVIENIWNFLQFGGIAFITESFGRVESAFPTHLAHNKQYDGKTDEMFVQAGFRLLKIFPDGRTLVFSKTKKTDPTRFDTLNTPEQEYPVRAPIKRIGKRIVRIFRS